MNKVDWSLAPEGATHKDFTNHGLWYKFDIERDQVSYWFHDHWTSCGTPEQYDDGSLDHMEERPKPTWSGPQDGLPPVNSVCEFVSSDTSWGKVKIIAHDDGKVVFKPSGDSYYGVTPDHKAVFRPFIDPEQQRETAIREFMDIVGIDCRVTAGKAVDAGFKREVV